MGRQGTPHRPTSMPHHLRATSLLSHYSIHIALLYQGLTPQVAQAMASFGIAALRGRQREAINATLAGRDCFVVMPTGA